MQVFTVLNIEVKHESVRAETLLCDQFIFLVRVEKVFITHSRLIF